ncbi:MAG: SIP domain-containing protein [Amaricoccus sp.]|uniref:SIP domain-containing protein n=1 Tax=Amaricoccus sp. TaxID=1872485 RepID=UPI0033147174
MPSHRRCSAHVTSLVAVTGAAEEQGLATRAEHRALWVHRPVGEAASPAPPMAALERHAFAEGDGFVWIAAEAGVAKAPRTHVLGIRGHPPQLAACQRLLASRRGRRSRDNRGLIVN